MLPRAFSRVSMSLLFVVSVVLVCMAGPATAGAAEDLASGQRATASSVSRTYVPANAVDGSASTRWSSEYADGQHWTVDLGRVRRVDTVVINWENAYASQYRILTSTDGSTYSTAADVTIASRATKTTTFAARDARYVRILGVERATQYGISFWDAQVYGPDATAPSEPAGGSLFPAPASYDWYVSPSGSTSNSGRSASSPTTLRYASQNALPGQTIGLLDGEYPVTGDAYGHGTYLRSEDSGSDGRYIRYRSINPYGARFVWKGGTPGGSMFYLQPGIHHVSLEYLFIDGASRPGSGVMGAGNGIGVKDKSHHVRLIGNYIRYTSASGVLVQNSDYVLSYANQVWQCGNNPPSSTGSWGSAINYHNNYYNHDTAPGFHNAIIANVAGGTVDTSQYHSDGNGIILDNPSPPSGFVNSPILIANNVIYMNGGRGIHTLKYGHAWIVNNTVYKNGLDTRVGAPTGAPQYMAYAATDVNYVNNASVSWGTSPNYALYSGASARFWRNSRYQGGTDAVPSTTANDPNQIQTANPLFAGPPAVAATGDRQWLNAPDPRTLGTAFSLADTSPLIGTGIDPRSIPALDALLDATTTQYLTHDQTGAPRPQGTGDIGAREK
jgi:hypothetical protein